MTARDIVCFVTGFGGLHPRDRRRIDLQQEDQALLGGQMSRHSYEAEFDRQCRIDEARTRANCFCQTEGFQCRGGWRCPLRETELANDVPPDASRSFSGSVKAKRGYWATVLRVAVCVWFIGVIAMFIRAVWGHA